MIPNLQERGVPMTSPTTEPSIFDLEEQTLEENDSIEVPPADIIAYNELRSCADLYRMYREDVLEIRPQFQCELVWPIAAQTRFVDSLVKQLPIPSMCFALDYKTQKWQVIDGLQRMWTIIRFLRGDRWHLSSIPDVDPHISGKYVPYFSENQSNLRQYYLRVENFTLPITVIRCDVSKPSHMEYLFTIFHRLNTGAVRLNNQEIRNCIFSGPFNDFLKEIDRDATWQRINPHSSFRGKCYRGQEVILRFFAFHDKFREYNGRLATFLNNYMLDHRRPNEEFLNRKRELFRSTVEIVWQSILDGDTHDRMSITVMEATLVGVSLNLDTLDNLSADAIRRMYKELLRSEEFTEDRLRQGLSAKPRVIGRMKTAAHIFSGQGNGKQDLY